MKQTFFFGAVVFSDPEDPRFEQSAACKWAWATDEMTAERLMWESLRKDYRRDGRTMPRLRMTTAKLPDEFIAAIRGEKIGVTFEEWKAKKLKKRTMSDRVDGDRIRPGPPYKRR